MPQLLQMDLNRESEDSEGSEKRLITRVSIL